MFDGWLFHFRGSDTQQIPVSEPDLHVSTLDVPETPTKILPSHLLAVS